MTRPDDPLEREAERTATRVAAVRTRPAATDDREVAAGADVDVSAAVVSLLQAPGSGEPVRADVAAAVAPHLAVDPSETRVHRDARAASAARELGARAFTVGSDVFLGAGESPGDLHLMAHEITHVAQQTAPPAALAASPELHGGAGNRAVERLLGGTAARLVLRSGGLTAADEATLRQLETRLAGVAAASGARGTSILTASDDCIRDLQAAKDHLLLVAANYRTAHDAFTGVLHDADAEYEFDQSVSDAVQGILVAALLTVLLPEALVTAGAMAVARGLVASTSAGLTRAGIVLASARAATPALLGQAVNAAGGEVAEMATGAAIGAVGTAEGRPSESAGLAGPSTTDKFATVLGALGTMIDAVPAWGAAGSSQHEVGQAASQLSATAAQLRAGDTLPVTVADVERRTEVLQLVDTLGVAAMPSIEATRNRVASLKNQALAVRLDDPAVIEDQLWTRWMASLIGSSADEMLDNDVISDYLEKKGMVDFGDYTFDSEQSEAVTAAQRRWLRSVGIDPGASSSITLSKFKAHTRLEQLRGSIVGRSGTLRDTRHVLIDGEVYDYPQNAGALPEGTAMVALHVIIKPHLQGDVNIDRWTNDCFDVYCNPATP
ncbi:eCIS core domain-containing protein [Cellulomonas xylanilytica]|uniref:eCIS core domain-containing protein n=1 Tax=Cellulomonas xylanilytica TaxID=233583 RepID=UPI001649A3FD|nr:DUF4157 domain-containing protein [Cellulomonas xylanilytica]